MALALDKLGTPGVQIAASVDPAAALAYAAATNDDNPAYGSGAVAPPVFAVVPAWDAIVAVVNTTVPPVALTAMVHGEQDMHFHRPLRPGMSLLTTAALHNVRVARSTTRFTVMATSRDARTGETVVEQYATLVLLGVTGGENVGPDKPSHAFPDGARPHRVGEHRIAIGDDQTLRYRHASGDANPIHLDEDAARAAGLPGVVLHGMCTMAMAGASVVRTIAGHDPTRLRRLALRFARPVLPCSDLTTSVYDAGPAGEDRWAYAFECHSRGKRVVADGRAEVDVRVEGDGRAYVDVRAEHDGDRGGDSGGVDG